MVPCLHQSNVYITRKLRVLRVQKYTPLVGVKTSLTSVGLQTTPSQVSQYMAENGNLHKSGFTFCRGTVFAPKECLYQKEATGMECLKMYSASQCKNCTYVCRPANYTISCKISGNSGLPFAMVPCLHQSSVYIKRKLRVRRVHKRIALVGSNLHLPVRSWKLHRVMWGCMGPETEICRNSGLPFAMVPCLHQNNVYMKRKLRVRRVQNCIPLVGAKMSLTCASLQTIPSHVKQ